MFINAQVSALSNPNQDETGGDPPPDNYRERQASQERWSTTTAVLYATALYARAISKLHFISVGFRLALRRAGLGCSPHVQADVRRQPDAHKNEGPP